MTKAMSVLRAGRPKSGEKRQAILAAASTLFLERGLQGTSMDAIAGQAGVSKQTVYSHFRNKQDLFRACVQTKVASYGLGEGGFPDSSDPRETLFLLVKRFMRLIFDPEVVALHRVVIGEAVAHPRIASLFFESGPAATRAAVGACLGKLVDCGFLRPLDGTYAAWQLLHMAFGQFHLQLQFGLIREVPEAELDAHLRRVVEDFLGLYARREPA